MKLLQVVANNERAGAQLVAHMLECELRLRGHDVETCYLYPCDTPGSQVLPGRILLQGRPGLLGARAATRAVRAELRARRPDAVLSHMPATGVAAQLAAAAERVPARIAVHHNPSSSYGRSARVLDRLLGTAGVYTRSVSVSESVAKSFASYPGSYRARLCVIPNGVPPPNVPAGSRDELRQMLGLPLDRPLLANVGRLTAQKNQEALLHLLCALPEVAVAVAGDGELRSRLTARATELGISDRLFLLGSIPAPDVTALLAAADLFVFPSRYEGMPLALIEAMAIGLPAVASDIPSNRETAGDTAVLVAPDDTGSWVEAVRGLLSTPARRQALGEAARVRSVHYSVAKMASAYLELMQPAVRS